MAEQMMLPNWAVNLLQPQPKKCYQKGDLLILDDKGIRYCSSCYADKTLSNCHFRLPDSSCKDANDILQKQRPFTNIGLV